MNKKGILYIVPTPIGNLKDITIRAIDVLKAVFLIAAEDTRTSKKLLIEYNIDTKLISYHKFNERKRSARLIELLNGGEDIAIISDAGTPGISDPAAVIVNEAIINSIEVITLPGATAFVPALVDSGFNTENFIFAGFLPSKKKDISLLLNKIKESNFTAIFYEAPHRLFKTLAIFSDILGNREIFIAREISKMFETHYRGDISDFLNKKDIITLKGEFVIIINSAKLEELSFVDLTAIVNKKIADGLSAKDAVKYVSERYNCSKNNLYNHYMKSN